MNVALINTLPRKLICKILPGAYRELQLVCKLWFEVIEIMDVLPKRSIVRFMNELSRYAVHYHFPSTEFTREVTATASDPVTADMSISVDEEPFNWCSIVM